MTVLTARMRSLLPVCMGIGLFLPQLLGCPTPASAIRSSATASATLPGGSGTDVDRAESVEQELLPARRPPGDWLTPRDRAERSRLSQRLNANASGYQECVWRYGGALRTVQVGGLRTPVFAIVGVGTDGRVRWLELESGMQESSPLHRCLSRHLIGLEFQPAPAHPTQLKLVLPVLDGPG